MANLFFSKYKRISVLFFGWAYDKNKKTFDHLQEHMRNANMGILVKAWVSMSALTAILVLFATALGVYAMSQIFIIEALYFYVFLFSMCVLTTSTTLLLFYIYPIEREDSRRKSIDNNLPFATIHMSAVASAGIPIDFMFGLISSFTEYGEVSEDAKTIMRNIKTFGMNYIDAIKDVENKTPSTDFKSLLSGIVSTVQSGGDLVTYLNSMAEKALFDYRIKREKYVKTLATYADIYTVLLVAAPLMMISLLATMSIIGGEIMGMSIQDLMFVITWLVLPLLNVAFIAFIHITYPNV
ncbi:MAG: type II secretion system F family protein [Candidatus Aenigmarchaeota archaeon]|nr:type II secretion system F family protein [Candidatus Aenigmarchaeota archaeon]